MKTRIISGLSPLQKTEDAGKWLKIQSSPQFILGPFKNSCFWVFKLLTLCTNHFADWKSITQSIFLPFGSEAIWINTVIPCEPHLPVMKTNETHRQPAPAWCIHAAGQHLQWQLINYSIYKLLDTHTRAHACTHSAHTVHIRSGV